MKPLALPFQFNVSNLFFIAVSLPLMACVHTQETAPPKPNKQQHSAIVAPSHVAPPTSALTSDMEAAPAKPFEEKPADNAVTAPPPIPQIKEEHPLPPVTADCEIIAKFPNDEPVFIKSLGILLTRIGSPCRTGTGALGHRKNAGWMTMGFPCTGGEGRIDWKGTNYNVPKMVSYLLETSCPMAPTDQSKIVDAAVREIGLSRNGPMIAFTPFVVQYWEIPGYEDADTTFSVEIRSNKGLSGAWSHFIKQSPIKVFLVGRENAWVPGNFMYGVDAELIWMSKNRFMLKVTGARPLKGAELDAVRTRCEALRPERECTRVF